MIDAKAVVGAGPSILQPLLAKGVTIPPQNLQGCGG